METRRDAILESGCRANSADVEMGAGVEARARGPTKACRWDLICYYNYGTSRAY